MQSELLKVARPTEKKIEFLMEKYKVSQEEVELAIVADPTENLYVEWLIRMMRSSRLRLPEQTENIKMALEKFNQTKNSPAFKAEHSPDINRWIPDELIQLFIQENLHEEQKSETKKEKDIIKDGAPGAKIIFNTPPWKVFQVTDPSLASFLGSNTSWCTTQRATAKDYLKSGDLFIVYKNDKPWAQYHHDESEYGDEVFMDTHDRELEKGFNKELQAFLEVCHLEVFSNYRVPQVQVEKKDVGKALANGFTFDELRGVNKGDLVGTFWTSILTKTPVKMRLGAEKKKFYEAWFADGPLSYPLLDLGRKLSQELARHWEYVGRAYVAKTLNNVFLARATADMIDSDFLEIPNDDTPIIDNFNKPDMVKAILAATKVAVKGRGLDGIPEYWAKYPWFCEKVGPLYLKHLNKAMLETDDSGDENGIVQEAISKCDTFKVPMSEGLITTIVEWIKNNMDADYSGVLIAFINSLKARCPPLEDLLLHDDHIDDLKNALHDYAKRFRLKVRLHD